MTDRPIGDQLDAARALAGAGRTAEARAALEQLLANEPNCAVAHFELADILTDAGELLDSLRHYELGLLAEPTNCDAWLAAAEINYIREQFVEAAHDLSEGLRRCPQDHRLLHRLGLVYDVLEDFGAGGRMLRKATEVDPENVEYLLDLGRHYFHFGKDEDLARTYITEALRRDLNNITARVALVDLLLAQNKPGEALQVLPWLARLRPNDPHVSERYAIAFEKSERWDDAVDAWRAVSLKRHEAYYFNRLAQASWEAQDADAAQVACRRAIELDEEMAEPHLLLAMILFESGADDTAVKEFAKALRLDLGYVRAVAPRALVALFLEQSPDAAEWEAVLKEGWRYD